MKHNSLKLLILFVLVVFSCSQDDEISTPGNDDGTTVILNKVLTIETINEKIETALKTKEGFNWKKVSAHTLWSAVQHGDNIVSIGYGADDESFNELRSSHLETIKKEILAIIAKNEDEDLTRNKESVFEYEIINVMDVKIKNLKTIQELLKADNIRYLEPTGYNHFDAQTRSSSGCSMSGQSINTNHYQTIAPNNAQVAWNF